LSIQIRAMQIGLKLADSTKLRLPRAGLAHVRDAVMFAACYIALDWASYIYPLGPFNITPWNPQPALSIVWMMLGGLGYAPLVGSTIFWPISSFAGHREAC